MANVIKHYAIGRTRKELSDYVLNCTDDELFDLCSVINEGIIGITTWSCEECKKRFKPNCDAGKYPEPCITYFNEMNKPFVSCD